MKTIAKQTTKHVFEGRNIESTYVIVTRSGRNGESLQCVEVSHKDIDLGFDLMGGTIGNFENPDKAWATYQTAIKSNAMGGI